MFGWCLKVINVSLIQATKPMKYTLYLLRHSYAEPSGAVKDFDRSLTTTGQNTVRTLGRKLQSEGVNISQVICSSAARAKETVINLIEEVEITEQLIKYEEKVYEASVRELLEIVNGLDKTLKTVLLVGHNPSISFFGEYLTGASIGNAEPCGLIKITFDQVKWEEVSQGTGSFVSYYHPNHE